MVKRKKTALQLKQEKELQSLKKKGLLKAEDVVAFAKSPKTALHKKFEWDNTKAAHEHRLWQAREMIVHVRVFIKTAKREVQVFVSLSSDRANPGGGYRERTTVLSIKKYREELLAQALADFKFWEEKYLELKELAPIFAAAAKIRKS